MGSKVKRGVLDTLASPLLNPAEPKTHIHAVPGITCPVSSGGCSVSLPVYSATLTHSHTRCVWMCCLFYRFLLFALSRIVHLANTVLSLLFACFFLPSTLRSHVMQHEVSTRTSLRPHWSCDRRTKSLRWVTNTTVDGQHN